MKKRKTQEGNVMLRTKVCQYSDWLEPWWPKQVAKIMDGKNHLHMKLWEIASSMQALEERGMLASGKKGVGFAVGEEFNPSIYAGYGCDILATDLEDKTGAWGETGQNGMCVESLYYEPHCSKTDFDRLVRFRQVDMRAIPEDLFGQFDFCWSICALEHIGSPQDGFDFVLNSLKCLKPGGVCFHTTHFNCSSRTEGHYYPGTNYYCQTDFEQLEEMLKTAGYQFEPFDYEIQPHNNNTGNIHLLEQMGFVQTAFRIIVST